MSTSKMKRGQKHTTGARVGPYNRPRYLEKRNSLAMATEGEALNKQLKDMTEAMRKVLPQLPEIPDFDTLPSPQTNADADEQAGNFQKLGEEVMALLKDMKGGGNIYDTFVDRASEHLDAGKDLFLGVYATYLMKPVADTGEAVGSMLPRLKTYIDEEMKKFVNLDSDSQVLRTIKIFVTLSTIYTMAPYAVGGAAAVTPFIMNIVSETAIVIIPLLPTIMYYLAGLGFLARYGAGYYSMMAIVNFYLFPTDLITPTSAVLGYMIQKHITDKHPKLQDMGEAFVAEKKQEIIDFIEKIKKSGRAGTSNIKENINILSRPLFSVVAASDDLLKVLVDTMMDTHRLVKGDVSAAKQYIQFLIDTGRAYRNSGGNNAVNADLIANPETTGAAVASEAPVVVADEDIVDLGIGAHLLANAIAVQVNNKKLSDDQATAVAMALLDLSEGGPNAAAAAAPAGGKRRSKKTKKNNSKSKSNKKHKKQTKKQKKQTKKYYKKRQAKKHTKKH